jgi:hypothetical protein
VGWASKDDGDDEKELWKTPPHLLQLIDTQIARIYMHW